MVFVTRIRDRLRPAVVLLLLALSGHAAAVIDSMEQRAKACTGCHGPQGQSRPDGYVPRLAGKPAGYLVAQMQNFRDGRRTHVTMARLFENLDDAMLRELAQHFAAQMIAYPAPASAPPSGEDARRAETLVRHGDAQRGIPACGDCHGAALTGIAPHVPGLVGLPRDYLVGQLGAWRLDARRARAPDCMATIAQRLRAEDVGIVSQWLAAQPVPVPSTPSSTPPVKWPLECGVLAQPAVQATRAPPTSDIVARGAYLARIGNCAGCHTAPGGEPFAGGLGIPTPFGTAFVSNITPDAGTGIGSWTAEDFWRAMHEGRSRDGRRLVPAFPYTSYTRISREDSDAIFAYLRSIAPVRQAARAHDLRFPFGTQAALAAWQLLYFTPAATPVRDASPVARGEYLVRGLGHCDACHSPRNRLGAPTGTLDGGEIPAQGWYAPSLHPVAGGSGTPADLVTLLRAGRNAHGSATGPMATVVRQSTQHWSEADLAAAAAYLATLPPEPPKPAPPRPSAETLARGERLYLDRCADCHGRDGRGETGAYPPLAGNPSVLRGDAQNLVQVVRHGTFGPVTASVPRPYGMPPQDLTDADMAALLTWVRQSWGNAAAAVTTVDVARTR